MLRGLPLAGAGLLAAPGRREAGAGLRDASSPISLCCSHVPTTSGDGRLLGPRARRPRPARLGPYSNSIDSFSGITYLSVVAVYALVRDSASSRPQSGRPS